jgi:glycosyltransferase involved in cell wall biosynthesis
MGEMLADAGADLRVLGWRRPLDALPLLRLRRLVKAVRPDVIHAWRQGCAIPRLALAREAFGKLVASPGSLPRDGAFKRRWHRWLLSQADLVCAGSLHALEQLRQLQIPRNKLHLVRACVSVDNAEGHGLPDTAVDANGLPADKRYILCSGPFADYQGYRDALWAFDILRYRYDDLDLVMAGQGPAVPRLAQFVRNSQCTGRVHFVGSRPSLRPFIKLAASVWVPRLHHGGKNVVLEAMAESRPVVASRLPELGELIVDGTTGFLVLPGDKVGFARRTRSILNEPAAARTVGEAGRRWVEENASASKRAWQVLQLYEGADDATALGI